MQQAKSQVCVITRTKDRPDFLRRAIHSVTNQSYKKFIHLIINDGGDRETVEAIVGSVNESDRGRIIIIHRASASNAPDTIFNEAIDQTVSKYIAIHDDDDTWHPEFLEQTVELLDSGHEGVVVRTDRVDEKIAKNGTITITKRSRYMPDLKSISLYQQCAENQLTPISFVYRRDAYESVGKYDTSLPVVGDWEFGIRFLLKFDIAFLDPGFALANYHRRKSTGDNSFATHNHRHYFNLVANRYLRDELNRGVIGPGYIISKIRYERSYMARLIRTFSPSFVTNRLKGRY